jgi:hypothetical protein
MRTTIKGALAAVAVLGAAAASPSAWAGCGAGANLAPADWSGNPAQLRARANFGPPTIVGMWSVQFMVNGSQFDFGYAQWHADGTELMNSGTRAPSTQNFCMGVWTQTGPLRYHLNHFALSYDGASGALNAKVNIKEDVTLAPQGDAFSGPFSVDVYDPTGATLLQHVAGQITGRRVPAN